MRLVCAAVLAAAVAGCGGGGARTGGATLWVTRDEGATVLRVANVPAGLTAMQALDREVNLSTRYGGRFVQSIDGLRGSLSGRRDWFYFVNGLEADRSAAEYRLRPGDVEWWDYRNWGHTGERVSVVVGAFPEPFVHGYDGKVRPAVVEVDPGLGAAAKQLARLVHARAIRRDGSPLPHGANVLRLTTTGKPRFVARLNADGSVVFDYCCALERLARHPRMFRFRYAA